MKWVVEENLFVDSEYTRFLDDLEKMDKDVVSVKSIPFYSDKIPEIEVDGPAIVMGSYTLCRIAIEKNWHPGVFTNKNFDYRVWNSVYGNDLLNPDSQVVKLGKMKIENPSFVRPVFDFKDFSGTVIDHYDFPKWKEKVFTYNEDLTDQTLVVISKVRKILREYRLFVVDGEIITGSQYKIGSRVVSDSLVDNHILEFAKKMISKWRPDVAFVVDIADTEDGPKIIEFNCLNAAGFYACDCQKIIEALSIFE